MVALEEELKIIIQGEDVRPELFQNTSSMANYIKNKLAKEVSRVERRKSYVHKQEA